MDQTAVINLSVVGEETGNPYDGRFTVNLVLSRREGFVADERRRAIVGSIPEGAPPVIQGEAFMLGQLYVRVADGPQWWTDSDKGLDLKDLNVIAELYKLVNQKVDERKTSLGAQAKQSLEKMAKNAKKVLSDDLPSDPKRERNDSL